jgi:hypothetical protein
MDIASARNICPAPWFHHLAEELWNMISKHDLRKLLEQGNVERIIRHLKLCRQVQAMISL